MIGKSNLQFTNATQLNDPFDCHPKLFDYSNVPEQNLRGGIPAEWCRKKEENDATNLRNETWLCSLSKVNNSILMWSHYCYNHKGVCIGLNMDKVVESFPPMFGQLFMEPLVIDVQYKTLIERPNKYIPTQDLFTYQWRTKAKEWEYEQEVRLVIPKPSHRYAALTKEQTEHPKEIWDCREIHYYMPIKGECFESIYFGINTDESKIERLSKFACEELNADIKLYKMKEDDNAFKLQPEVI